jgi:hypothetical protein
MRFIITISMAALVVASPMARHSQLLHQIYARQDNSTSGVEVFTCASDKYTVDQVK